MRETIAQFEAALLTLTQVDVPLTHYFAKGLYLREGHVAAGTAFTGKIHKTEHFCILVSGEVTVTTEEGSERFVGPCVIHARPGAKRAAFCHTDVVWINVHANPTDETELEKLEAELVTENFDDPSLLAATEALPCLS